MEFRRTLKDSDLIAIREILNSSGFFYDFEVDVALELAVENLKFGEDKSGYIFLLVDIDNKPVAYACYGKNPSTFDSFDLYWIAVHKDYNGKGIGKKMVAEIEKDVARLAGKRLWIETSSRALYEPTRQFYLHIGYQLIAELPDYYTENDSKCVYLKKIL